MKKILFLSAIICFLTANANAQLANTKWSGTANLLQQDQSLVTVNIIWDFGKDTVAVSFPDALNSDPEIMTYSIQKSIIKVTKVSGGSPCEAGTEATIKYEIKDDKLFLTVTASKCDAFTKALDGKPYNKVK